MMPHSSTGLGAHCRGAVTLPQQGESHRNSPGPSGASSRVLPPTSVTIASVPSIDQEKLVARIALGETIVPSPINRTGGTTAASWVSKSGAAP